MNKKTGLCIKTSEITKGEEGFEWALDEDDKDDTEMALELNFLVESEELPEEVKLNSEQHLESVWADERDIGGFRNDTGDERRGGTCFCFLAIEDKSSMG